MEIITELSKINFISYGITTILLFTTFKAFIMAFEWIMDWFGIETKWMRKKKEEHELLIHTSQNLTTLQQNHDESVQQSIRHDEMIKSDILSLTDTINGIALTLKNMQNKENETKIKELKGSLIRYYNKYKNIGEWSKLEKDAFWDLFDDYEKRGGDGYIHTIVEPVMRELREVD